MSTVYGLLIINIACIFACYEIARQRRADARFWGWMGALLGPLAVPFVFFAQPKDK